MKRLEIVSPTCTNVWCASGCKQFHEFHLCSAVLRDVLVPSATTAMRPLPTVIKPPAEAGLPGPLIVRVYGVL